ncbi:ATP-dependent DNA helicase RecG [Candidatus Curtissbacteria bacterium]|nr:ATP-dependent DNA helicase RecG [Candidatus Curtissbacteria bacterium]
MLPTTPIENLPGVGNFYSSRLSKLELNTARDLVYHFPFRYEDFSQVEQIRDVVDGEKLSIQGVIWQIRSVRTRTGKFLTNATVADTSGTIEVIWFNQPYLTKTLKAGTPISLSGKVKVEGSRPKLMSPTWEIIRSPLTTDHSSLNTLHTGRLVAVYPETEGITSKWFRAKIALVLPRYLEKLEDYLPEKIIKEEKLISLPDALKKIHQPDSFEDVETARKRLGFDELLLIQLVSLKRQLERKKSRIAPKMKIEKDKIEKLTASLPYKLTTAQNRAIGEILADLTRQEAANRLLEGDVGSGKTIVAATAAYTSFLNGLDALFAAPTEILAFQHYKTLNEILTPLGVKVGIWTGSKKTGGNITVGTHALLSTFKPERQVGLVIVDEQHRFGVAQRAKLFLENTRDFTPHLLTMTATPIPRTLALTLYGDLDLSVLDEMPKGRQKIATFVVPNKKRNDAYKFIEKQVEEGRQAFIITPFVEPSESMVTVKAAKEEFEKLKEKFDKKIKLGLLHGQLKSKEKEEIINKFNANKIHILVSTPVVEVGIDVPNASVMMIESAERFGLAQLHQLRGRVGRGEYKSYCLLFSESNAENSINRLKSMEKVHVGFELAEIDLKMRGPGEVFGLRQSGFFNFKIADIADRVLVARAQQHARQILEKDPDLFTSPLLKEELDRLNPEYSQPN